ncbi:MAG: cob(I)yrinic acid a,c-diamide adenosyltransferase [Chloroflexota bacterium]
MARVTTKTGDEGYTDLLGSGRVPKYHRRPEAYGTIDEASSALGLARAHCTDRGVCDDIYALQKDLYTLMAELATPPENYEKVDFKIRHDDVRRLDELGENYKQHVEIGRHFIVPGNSVTGAALDLARTVVRRGERQVARLYHDGDVTNVETLRYLNRLSDTLFVMARYVEREGAP